MRFTLVARRYGSICQKVLLAIVCLFVLSLCSASALARRVVRPGAVKAPPVVASTLDKALAALAAKDLPTASRLLTEAYRATSRTELLYHLGRLAADEGRVLEAHDLY